MTKNQIKCVQLQQTLQLLKKIRKKLNNKSTKTYRKNFMVQTYCQQSIKTQKVEIKEISQYFPDFRSKAIQSLAPVLNKNTKKNTHLVRINFMGFFMEKMILNTNNNFYCT